MAGPRRWIDPKTRAYVLENGAPRVDRTLASSVLLALATERGSCPLYDEDEQIGSRLHTIQHATPDAVPRARSFAFEALRHLRPLMRSLDIQAKIVDARELDPTGAPGKALAVTVSWDEGGRGGTRRSVTHSNRVGG